MCGVVTQGHFSKQASRNRGANPYAAGFVTVFLVDYKSEVGAPYVRVPHRFRVAPEAPAGGKLRSSDIRWESRFPGAVEARYVKITVVEWTSCIALRAGVLCPHRIDELVWLPDELKDDYRCVCVCVCVCERARACM